MISRPGLAYALVALALGCSGATDPSGHAVPSVGTYTFHMSFIDATQLGPVTLTYDGTLTLGFASADSVAGSWSVPGMGSALSLGFYNVDAYVIDGDVQSGGRTFTARVRRVSGGLACQGLLIDNTTLTSKPAPCMLTGPT